MPRIIATPVADFMAEHWERAPLLTRHGELPGGFADLLSSADVDRLVGAHGLRSPFFRMVDRASPVTGLTRSATAGNRTVTDLADPDAVARAYAGGATLVLQSLHRTWPPVAELCRGLASELGHPTQCNAYVTPAGDAQGFTYHHDTHDVLVLQVEGSKHWEVYEPVLELPTRDQPRSGPDLVADGRRPVLDVVLTPGDTLYLPRGWVHAAGTTDEPSIHLTVGVLATTWLDLLRDCVAKLGGDDVALRRAVPADATDPGAELLAMAVRWLGSLDAGAVGGLARRRRVRAEPLEPVGVTARAAAARALGPTTPVRARRGLDIGVSVAGGRVVIHLPDRDISIPGVAEAMVGRLLADPATSPAAAVEGDTGCDTADAVVVARRLVREGVLVGADPAP